MDATIIERVRKILARTEQAGCTAAEAEAAMNAASRLMAEHNLTMADMSRSMTDPGEEWANGSAHETGRWTTECNTAYGIVKEFFFVEALLQSTYIDGKRVKSLVFFGKESNVESAKWAFRAILEAYDRLFREHRKATGCPASDRRPFAAGVARGLADKMRDDRRAMEIERDIEHGTTGTALAIVSIQQETRREFMRRNPKLKAGRSNFAPMNHSRSAIDAGYTAGRNLNLSRPIGSDKGRKAIG